ncbi:MULTISPECIES: globin domain-containing protein [unclassified Streptomyces]|uniref:globin domain-containing protein n=1 Tax=unclassified Streptomyces TaxID=2593676 RepID=UPI002E0E4D7A|nr:FAD-binding oxidoreductase [Streptomyces sp. NBC_01207]WTA18656.1 FAD-binding oxidoreductase [Streptomyces sp. NBC_00853]
MLSEKSSATVRATLPAVGAAIGDIAELFYTKLFAAHPALIRDLFNRGNQKAGLQQQALAGSVAAFATHLLAHPDTRPDVMLGRIAHKHASLGVTREQYAVVHQHLFEAIAEVLGEAVTPEVAQAWDEVYWLMANALIALEERLYAEQRVVAGDVWRQWTVTERVAETADCTTFRITPADGAPAPAHRPGQYVSVQVELPDGARQIRQYSLITSPGSAVRAITVKRVHGPAAAGPAGEVSNHLHARVHAGATLRVSAPYGDLVLADSAAPVLLASAGIGCTPMLSMLEHLADTGHAAPVTVLHADRSPADHPLRGDHRALTHKLADASARFWYEESAEPGDGEGRMDLSAVPLAPGTRAYLCGPLPFMRAVREQLIAKGLPAADIHYEVFGPDLWLASA